MNINVQEKIEELSHRSRGRKPNAEQDAVVEHFQGHFRLAGGRLALPDLEFAVPGAKVQMKGQFALKPKALDFLGTLFMDAKVSETQSGIKSFVLKAVDPLFGKDGGGSAIPIKVGGTVNQPAVGLDVRRLFRRGR
jgi:hypothetical protein